MERDKGLLDKAFRTFVESAPVLCMAADRDFITLYVSPYYKEVHSIDLDEAVGKHLRDVIGQEAFDENRDYYEMVFEGHQVEHTGSFVNLDGNMTHYKATYAPIRDDGTVVGITGVLLNITAEVESETANAQLTILNKELELAKSELTKLASRDPLTELYNRRYFTDISENAFKLARRNEKPLSIILLDADDFKCINDSYGHDVGDRVLLKFSDVLRSQMRTSDVLCRWGGEEFIMLLHETDDVGAARVAEKIRAAIEANNVMLSAESELKFTASLGVATADFKKDKQLMQVIIRADKALYEAKGLGKNKVISKAI